MMQEAMHRFFLSCKGWTLFAGFSGGADSLALLLMLRQLRDTIPFELIAVHCEHGLRGAAGKEDAAFCREICRKYHIPFKLFELDVPGNRQPGESVEAAARRLRQTVWQQLAGGRKQTAVVLAHHAGDRRENLLLRLARGSGCGGLSGLRARRNGGGVLYLRPLLAAERESLELFLRQCGETAWRVDASNADIRYKRNFLRQQLLPDWKQAVPQLEQGLDASLNALEADALLLEKMAARYGKKLVQSGGDAILWQKIPAALHGRVLRYLARKTLHRDWIPGKGFLTAFRKLLARPRGGALPVTGIPGWRWHWYNGKWQFEAYQALPAIRLEWNWRKNKLPDWQVSFPETMPEKVPPDTACFDGGLLPETLLVASGEDGDCMVPFGRQTLVKWKKLRIDRKIPRKSAPPLLRMPDGEILWSPLIRHSAMAPVTAGTREIVCFQWKKGI